MKVFLLTALLTLASPQSAEDTATIDGRVLRAGSQDPIPNVQIALIKSAGGAALTAETVAALDSLQQLVSSAPRGISRAYLDSVISAREQALGLPPGTYAQAAASQTTTLTDAAGHFIFKNQAPGTYGIRAALEGYFGPAVNGSASPTITKSVTVESNRPVPPTDIFMVKGGVITGLVRDPNGQPVSGVDVAAARISYSNGRPQWTAAASRPTDDRGGFRIFWVSPGEYLVGVTPRNATATQNSTTRTFYPGVTDPAAATPVVIKDGSEVSGIDFSLPPTVPTPTYRIRGTATNPLAVPNPTTGVLDRNANSFMLVSREPGNSDYGNANPPTLQNSLPALARPNGEFELPNIRPGSYELFIYSTLPATESGRRYYIDRARVEVRDKDVEGVSLEIQKGTAIRGKVVGQGATALPTEKIKINLRSQDTMPDAFAIIVGAISVDSAGNFSAPDIPSARYSLHVTGLPETAYVADIRQVGATIFNTGLVLGSEPAIPLEIVVNVDGGTIEGSVQTPDRKPAGVTTVVLVPPVADRQNAMKYKSMETDDKGNFSMKGVPPGEYTMFVWESVPFTAWMNSDFLARYQNRGRRTLVTQGARLNVQLDLIPDGNGLR